MIPRHLTLTIDLEAIQKNFLFLQTKAKVCAPVLKADAYHVGAGPVGKALWDCGARIFCVAYIEEALALQKELPFARIIVFNGPYGAWDWPRFFKHHDLIPVINTLDDFYQWKIFSQQTKNTTDVCLHVDTGMNRLGLPWGEYQKIWQDCQNFRYVMSHLSSAEMACSEKNEYQKAKTDILKKRHPQSIISLANSSGIFLGYTYDMIRPGMALYGVNPIPYTKNPMHPVFSAKARILQIQNLTPGECVGYNETFVAKKSMRVATLACGYADGIPLNLNQDGYVLVKEKKAPIIGKISMDLMTIDVTDVLDVKVGSFVTLFDQNHTLDKWSTLLNITPHAIITNVLQGKRFKKLYIGESSCLYSSQQSVA
jgi:alanine racemase